MLAKKKGTHKQTSMPTRSHTHTEIDTDAAVSLKRPAVSIFVPEGTCQTPVVTRSETVPPRSPALSFIT